MFIVSVNHSRFSLIPKYQNHWKFCVQIACLFHSLYHNLWQHVPSKKVKQKKKHLTPASLEIAVITVEPVGKRDYSVNKMEKDPLASFIGQKALIIAVRAIESRSFFKSFWYCTLFRSWCPSGRTSGNFIPQKVGDVILKPAPNRSRTMSGSYYFN